MGWEVKIDIKGSVRVCNVKMIKKITWVEMVHIFKNA